MRNELRVVSVFALLMASVSLGQGTTTATKQAKQAAGSQKMMVMDPKMHEQMMGDAKKADEQIQSLKKAMADERAKGGNPAHQAQMMAEQKASDEQIEALQKTVKSLQKQIETGPHYLDQKNSNTP